MVKVEDKAILSLSLYFAIWAKGYFLFSKISLVFTVLTLFGHIEYLQVSY